MISSFVAPKAHSYIKKKIYIKKQTTIFEEVKDDNDNLTTGRLIHYKADKITMWLQAKKSYLIFTRKIQRQTCQKNRRQRRNNNLLPNKPYRLLLPMKKSTPSQNTSSQSSSSSNLSLLRIMIMIYELFLEVINVKPGTIKTPTLKKM